MNIKKLIDSVYPELFDKVRAYIEQSESEYDGKGKDSHLWEHSLQVASLSAILAEGEGQDLIIPVIAALFHDSGKFKNGSYHQDNEPEEEGSAGIADKILKESGVDQKIITDVLVSIRALYLQKGKKNEITAIIHDADFLAKSGPLGIAAFFTKGALRGRSMINSIIHSGSRELTYSNYLVQNMKTSIGKKLALKDKMFTQKYFEELLINLKEKDIADLMVKEYQCVSEKCGKIKLSLVTRKSCEICNNSLKVRYSFETGIKCEKVIAGFSCIKCKKSFEIAFCLPEIGE